MSSESFDTHIDTNLGGPFVATKVVGNAMKDRGIKGSIVRRENWARLDSREVLLQYDVMYVME